MAIEVSNDNATIYMHVVNAYNLSCVARYPLTPTEAQALARDLLSGLRAIAVNKPKRKQRTKRQ